MTRTVGRPSPQAAYAEWVAACAEAGWHAGLVAEQVSGPEVLAARAHVLSVSHRACDEGTVGTEFHPLSFHDGVRAGGDGITGVDPGEGGVGEQHLAIIG